MKQLSASSCSASDIDGFENEMELLYRIPPHPNIVKCA